MEQQYIERLIKIEQIIENQNQKIIELCDNTKLLQDLATSSKIIALEVKKTTEELKDIKVDVANLKGKPGARWELLIQQLFIVTVTFILGIVLTNIFK